MKHLTAQKKLLLSHEISGYVHMKDGMAALKSNLDRADNKCMWTCPPASLTEKECLDACVESQSVVLKLSFQGTRSKFSGECINFAQLMMRNNIY